MSEVMNETHPGDDPLAFSGRFDLNDEVAYWIQEVEEELKEIERQQQQLTAERAKYEGTLLWLKQMRADSESEDIAQESVESGE